MLNASVPDNLKNSQQGLLPDIFHELPSADAVPQLQEDQFAEIAGKMLLNLGIAIPQPPKIIIIERLKMHRQPREQFC